MLPCLGAIHLKQLYDIAFLIKSNIRLLLHPYCFCASDRDGVCDL